MCLDVIKVEIYWIYEVDVWECVTKCIGIYIRDFEIGSLEIIRDIVIFNLMGCKILNYI